MYFVYRICVNLYIKPCLQSRICLQPSSLEQFCLLPRKLVFDAITTKALDSILLYKRPIHNNLDKLTWQKHRSNFQFSNCTLHHHLHSHQIRMRRKQLIPKDTYCLRMLIFSDLTHMKAECTLRFFNNLLMFMCEHRLNLT